MPVSYAVRSHQLYSKLNKNENNTVYPITKVHHNQVSKLTSVPRTVAADLLDVGPTKK